MAIKRPLSTKGKVITGIIYALAVILLVTVFYLNAHPDAKDVETIVREALKR